MIADKPFVFIHPDTGLKMTEKRGEPARLLHALHEQREKWTEAFELGELLHSLKVAARMSDLKKTYGPNLIEAREGRKGLNGKRLKQYRINPVVRVTREEGEE